MALELSHGRSAAPFGNYQRHLHREFFAIAVGLALIVLPAHPGVRHPRATARGGSDVRTPQQVAHGPAPSRARLTLGRLRIQPRLTGKGQEAVPHLDTGFGGNVAIGLAQPLQVADRHARVCHVVHEAKRLLEANDRGLGSR